MQLIELTAKKVKLTAGTYKGFFETHFLKPDGNHFATIPAYARQPRKDKKTIVLNCFKWAIKWA